MDIKQKLIMLFEHNMIDSGNFDLNAFSVEATVITNKIRDIKANNTLLTHEPIFSLHQKRGESKK